MTDTLCAGGPTDTVASAVVEATYIPEMLNGTPIIKNRLTRLQILRIGSTPPVQNIVRDQREQFVNNETPIDFGVVDTAEFQYEGDHA
jgi:hypothetical protein